MKKVTLYLADDHAILREGLRHILNSRPDLEIAGESGDGKTALEDIERIKPAVVILDISLPVMTGIDVARQLKKFNPDIKIIILSRHDNEEYVNNLLHYGIDGYVLKESAGEDLLKAIEEALEGNLYISPRITRMLVSDVRFSKRQPGADMPAGPPSMLSEREKEVVKLIAEGHTSNDIGKLLRISGHTVKVHRFNIMQKLNIKNTADLVKYAIREGLVEV
jgi:DNA-binding NarL/FixJ family response regulator